MPVAWVVGASGLLGRALTAELGSRREWDVVEIGHLPWGDDARFPDAVGRAVDTLLAAAAGGEWAVFWAAGAAVTNSTEKQLQHELDQFQLVIAVLGRRAEDRGSGGRGRFFYASSAGGVYGGSSTPPFNENTVPRPLSPYGRYKLKAESASVTLSASGIRVLNGRISNLYGPGQRLEKMQGLISQLARAQYSPTPASVYVPLETVRDYIYVPDCAALICDAVERLGREETGTTHVKIIASGVGTSIASLLGYFRTIAKGHPHVMLAASPIASMQGRDLRLTSAIWTELDRRELTPLPAGIASTMLDIMTRLQGARVQSARVVGRT
jgi:UDP-glucose 4-epimerase